MTRSQSQIGAEVGDGFHSVPALEGSDELVMEGDIQYAESPRARTNVKRTELARKNCTVGTLRRSFDNCSVSRYRVAATKGATRVVFDIAVAGISCLTAQIHDK